MSEPMDCDIIVIGGGLAGLTAAICSATAGASVRVLEQGDDPRYLCNSRITMGVFQIALTDMQSDPSVLRKAIQHATRGSVDPGLADCFAAEAGPSIRWLQAQSIRLIRGGAA